MIAPKAGPTRTQLTDFQKTIWDYFATHQRPMPWREPELDGTFDPYKILVSEMMLQQTQVSRVIPKFREFTQAFPTGQDLAATSIGEVLKIWSGLGYNRRAKFLWQAAQKVVQDFGGQFPQDLHNLQQLPGVGANTAGAILAYAYNQPAIFIETNIRTVFIHHFFQGQTSVPDSAIRPLLEKVLQRQPPRQFYWALMDYGTYLKATAGNASRASKGYVKQTAFQGSRRQIRGQVLRLLTTQAYNGEDLAAVIGDNRLEAVLKDLIQEQLIQKVDTMYKVL